MGREAKRLGGRYAEDALFQKFFKERAVVRGDESADGKEAFGCKWQWDVKSVGPMRHAQDVPIRPGASLTFGRPPHGAHLFPVANSFRGVNQTKPKPSLN